jgi:heterodisulfide reductase subunit B2
MDIAYYPGCSLKQTSGIYDQQSVKVFKALGINLKEIDDWNCCGATSAGKYDDFLAIAMPARNIGIAENEGFDEIIIPCSACYSRTLVAQARINDDAVLKDEINADIEKKIDGSLKVSSILEVFLPLVESGELKKKATRKLKQLKPVCYYGCMLTRFSYNVAVPDNVENPQGMEKVLKALGIKAIDWNCKTDCCGASAAVNDSDTSLNLMARIMNDALARGANCMVTTCPMCQLNMDAYQEAYCEKHGISERLPVYFITEIVGMALGMGADELLIDTHITPSTELIEASDKELEKV